MSLDLKLATIFFGLAVMFLVITAGASLIRSTIDKAIASSGHAFYLRVTGHEPKCPTCPFKKHCPYYGIGRCAFAPKVLESIK